MNPAHLENIEMRLAGATFLPWRSVTARDFYGKLAIPDDDKQTAEWVEKVDSVVVNSRPIHVLHSEDPKDETPYVSQRAMEKNIISIQFKQMGGDADTTRFIAHAPADMEALVREVKRQRNEIETLDIMVATHKKRAREGRAKAADLQAQLTRLTAALATVREVLDADQQNSLE